MTAKRMGLHVGTGTLCLFLCAVASAQKQTAKKDDPVATQEYIVNTKLMRDPLFGEAETRWKKFLKDHPKDSRIDRVHHHLGACQLHLKKYEDAAKTYRTLIAKYPKFKSLDAARYNLGLALYNLAGKSKKPEDFRAAAKVFSAVAAEHPTSTLAPTAAYYRAECLYHAGDVKQVLPVYAAFIKKFPESDLLPDVYYALGTTQQELGSFAAAAKTYRRFTKEFPKHKLADECKLRTGLCLFNEEKFQQAESIFAPLAKKNDFPFVDLALLQLAQCRHKAGKPQDALGKLRTLLKKYPQSSYRTAALLETGQCLFETGKFQQAEQPLREVVKAKSDESANAAYWLARTLLQRDKPAEAVAVLDKAISNYPKNPDLPLLNLTRIDALYEQPEKRKSTVAQYAAFAAKYPDHELTPHAQYMAGFAALATEDYPAAAKYSAAFLNNRKWEQHPLVPDVLFVAGESRLLGEKPKLAEAETFFSRLVDKHPKHAQVPQARLRLGYCRHQAKKYDEAVALLSTALKELKQPELVAEAHLLIGRSHGDAGRDMQAITAFRDALKAHPKWERADEVMLRLAIKLRLQEQTDEASKHLTTLLSKFPDSRFRGETLYELGEIAESKQKYDDALRRYREVLEKHADGSSAPQAAYGIGRALFAKKDFEGAAKAYGVLMTKYPKSPLAAQARYDRAIAYHRLEKFQPALSDLQTFLANKPAESEAFEARFAVALCQVGLKRHDDAVKTLQQLLKEQPADASPDKLYYELAHAFKALKKEKAAQAAFHSLVTKEPDSPHAAEAWYHIGLAHRNAEQWKQAATAYATGLKAAKQTNWREELQHELGYVQYRTGKYADAAETFAAQLKAFPKGRHVNAATYLAGECRFNQSKWSQALPYFVDSIKQNDPRYHSRALYRAGACAARLKDWSASRKHYTALLQADPKFEQINDARYGLGMAYQMQDKLDEARTEYRRILEATKGKNTRPRAQALFMLGECNFREKKHKRAIVRYVEAALYPDKPLQAQCHYEIGRCYIELKNRGEALKSLKTVVNDYPNSGEAKLAAQLIESLQKQ